MQVTSGRNMKVLVIASKKDTAKGKMPKKK